MPTNELERLTVFDLIPASYGLYAVIAGILLTAVDLYVISMVEKGKEK